MAYLILSAGVLVTMGYAAAQQGHPWSEIILPVAPEKWLDLDADTLDGLDSIEFTSKLFWSGTPGSHIWYTDGNVGVGTNSPSEKLDVDGSVRVRGLAGCDTIDTDASGNLACGTDNDGVGVCSECDPSFVNEGQANSISSAMIADGSVASADLANNAVTSSKIQDGSVASADLANGAVSNAKLADNAVTSSKIQDGTIGSADIDSGQVQRRVTGGCSGQVVVDVNQDGSLVCEPDDSGASGDITGVTAGSGLTGGGSSGSVTLNVGSGTGISVGSNSVGLSYPSKSCPAGQAIRSFDLGSSSSPACEPDDVGPSGCSWSGWRNSGYVTTVEGVICESGNAACKWEVRTGLECTDGTITNVRMESRRVITNYYP